MAGSEIEGEVIWKGNTVGRCGELDLGKTNTVAKVQYGIERNHQHQRHTIVDSIDHIALVKTSK
jgi:hypothetical protein